MLGSSLFSVESELGQAEFAGGKIEHGDQVDAGTVAPSLAFGGAEDTVQALHEGIGQTAFPMGQNALQMVLNHLRQFQHGSKEAALPVIACHPAHPADPHLEAPP